MRGTGDGGRGDWDREELGLCAEVDEVGWLGVLDTCPSYIRHVLEILKIKNYCLIDRHAADTCSRCVRIVYVSDTISNTDTATN